MKFHHGLIVGYLGTSIFSIPSPPTWFWVITGVVSSVFLILFYVKYRLDDDEGKVC